MERQIAVVLLVGLAVAGLMYAFVYPYLSGDIKAQKRQAALTSGTTERTAAQRGGGVDPAKRRKAIADSLKDIETQNKKKNITLEKKRLGTVVQDCYAYAGAKATLDLLELGGETVRAVIVP